MSLSVLFWKLRIAGLQQYCINTAGGNSGDILSIYLILTIYQNRMSESLPDCKSRALLLCNLNTAPQNQKSTKNYTRHFCQNVDKIYLFHALHTALQLQLEWWVIDDTEFTTTELWNRLHIRMIRSSALYGNKQQCTGEYWKSADSVLSFCFEMSIWVLALSVSVRLSHSNSVNLSATFIKRSL